MNSYWGRRIFMTIITTKTQKQIIEAFLNLASNSQNQKITVDMIAKKMGMSRENIYHNHFKGIKDIIERIHFLTDAEIFCKFQSYVDTDSSNISSFLSKQLLPNLYEKKEWLKILYGTNVDPNWINFIESRYIPLVNRYLDSIDKKDIIPNALLSQIIVKEVIAIISVWLTDDEPEPPEVFIKKFLHVISQSPGDMLTQE